MTQRYVSNELSHFVGKGKTEEEQYQLLVGKILKSGWLTYAPHDPSQPRTASLDLSKPISTDDIIKYQVVCFCDIPAQDLAIHVRKYSKFGLAFKKEFLVSKGACPVFYIANESPVPVQTVFSPSDFLERIEAARKSGYIDRALYFDTSVRGIIDIFVALDALCCNENDRYFKGISTSEFKERFGQLLGLSPAQVSLIGTALNGNTQALQTIRMCIDFSLNYVFTFMKPFDAKRSFEDESNYYMEREWRVGNNIQFTLNDVSRVFFPSSYAQRFRVDMPAYVGQISFID
jgi:hypothetical protein